MTRAICAALIATAACAIAAPIGGCVTGNSYPKARTAVDVADAAFERIEARAINILPLLPASAAARVRAGLAIADVIEASRQG